MIVENIVYDTDCKDHYCLLEGVEGKRGPFEFIHEARGWTIVLGYSLQNEHTYTLTFDGVDFNDLPQAPARERAPLARSSTTINMDGAKKFGKFPIIRSGQLICVTILVNFLTKFAKLQVGKQYVTAKQR